MLGWILRRTRRQALRHERWPVVGRARRRVMCGGRRRMFRVTRAQLPSTVVAQP